MSNPVCPSCLMPDTGFSTCPHCGWRRGHSAGMPLCLSPGTVLNPPYQVARVLGHGGFGITYLGWDANLQIKVAIKEYLPREFASRDPVSGHVIAYSGDALHHFEQGLTGFLDEARTLAKFQQHPGIVSVLAFFRAFGTGYMVMEYVEGETLKSYLQQRQGRLNWLQTLEIFMQIMDALRAVHQAGLLHRDIAPDNIYLCNDGRIKLLDFGAARYAMGGYSQSLVVVKPGFAPEEQYRENGEQGSWSDVYSVAASIYYCLTGQTPPDALQRQAHDELKPPSSYGVAIPPAAEQILLKALAVRAFQRPQTIADLQHQLLSLQSVEPPGATRAQGNLAGGAARPAGAKAMEPPADEPNTHWQRWVLAGILALVVLSLIYRQFDSSGETLSQSKTIIVPADDVQKTPNNNADEAGVDEIGLRQRELAEAEELKQHQAAALRRFEDRDRQDKRVQEPGSQESQHQEHLRSLCDEWGATMGCKDSP